MKFTIVANRVPGPKTSDTPSALIRGMSALGIVPPATTRTSSNPRSCNASMMRGENAQSDDLDILLQGRGGDHLRSLKQPRIDDLEAGVTERSYEDFRTAVMT